MRMSASLISISTSSTSGSTATVAARGVDAALRLGVRHALHPVHAALELQPAEHALALDRGDDLLVAAGVALADALHLDPPAVLGGVALVHAEQVAGEQRRLVAAGAGPHLQDGRGVLVGVRAAPAAGPARAPGRAGGRRARRAPRAPWRPSPDRRRRPCAPGLRARRARPARRSANSATGLQLGVLLAEPHDLRPVAGGLHPRLHLAEAVENLVETGLGQAHGISLGRRLKGR